MDGIRDEDLLGITGCAVVGGRGETIGKLTDVRLDDASGVAEWGVVKTGMLGGPKLVPLVRAQRRGDDIFVPWDKGTVKTAPDVADPAFISEAEEMRLYSHYGVAFADAPTDPSTHSGWTLPQPQRAAISACTKAELYERARRLGIAGRSHMTKEALYEAVTAAGG